MLRFFARPIVKLALIIFLIVFVISALVRCEPNPEETVKQIYSQGYIDENGEVIAGDLTAAYTKKIIPCTGFRITREIDLDVYFVVHFYNEDGEVFLQEKVTRLNYVVQKGEMPKDSNGEPAVGIRVSVHLNDKTTGFSSWDLLTLASKLKIVKTSVGEGYSDGFIDDPIVDPTDDPVELFVP